MADAQRIFEVALEGGQLYHSVELTKNTRGYGWVIKVAGMDVDKARDKVVELEKFFREKYGGDN